MQDQLKEEISQLKDQSVKTMEAAAATEKQNAEEMANLHAKLEFLTGKENQLLEERARWIKSLEDSAATEKQRVEDITNLNTKLEFLTGKENHLLKEREQWIIKLEDSVAKERALISRQEEICGKFDAAAVKEKQLIHEKAELVRRLDAAAVNEEQFVHGKAELVRRIEDLLSNEKGLVAAKEESSAKLFVAAAKEKQLSDEKTDLNKKLETAMAKEKLLLEEKANLIRRGEAAAEEFRNLRNDLDCARIESDRLAKQLQTQDEEEIASLTESRRMLEEEKTRAKQDRERAAVLDTEFKKELKNHRLTLSEKDDSIRILEAKLRTEMLAAEAEIQQLDSELDETRSTLYDLRIELRKLKFAAQVRNDSQDNVVAGMHTHFSFLQTREPLKDVTGRQPKRPRLDDNDIQVNPLVGITKN